MAEIWGAVIGAAAAVGGAVVSSNGAKNAAKEQTKGADAAVAETRRQYDQTREDYAPYRETGGQALSAIARGLGLSGYSAPGTTAPLSFQEWQAQNPAPKPAPIIIGGRPRGTQPVAQVDQQAAYQTYVNGFKPTQVATGDTNTGPVGDFNRDFTIADFQKDPGYQFRMDEGANALEGSAAARGGLLSGRAGKELARYGQDYASGEYSNAYNRFNNDRTTRFNRLAAIANVGQTSTNATANAGENASNNVSNTMIDRANASAAGRVGQANAINSGLTSLGNYYLQRRYGSGNSVPPTTKPQPVPNYSDGGYYG